MTGLMTQSPVRRAVSRIKSVVIGIGAVGAVFSALVIALEGGASLLLFARDYASAKAPRGAERATVVHDTLLGWISRPSSTSPDEYGSGIALTFDALGVRGSGDTLGA